MRPSARRSEPAPPSDPPDELPAGYSAEPARSEAEHGASRARSGVAFAVIIAVAFTPLLAYGLGWWGGPPGRPPGAATRPPTAAPPPSGVIAQPGPVLGDPPAVTVAPDAPAYHVDCAAGDDEAAGRRPDEAWRTLARAARAEIQPGERLLLKRGCRWQGPLVVPWQGTATSPIAISTYGDGDRPVIEDALWQVEVRGAHLQLEGLALRTRPPSHAADCDDQPAGRSVGVRLVDGSHHVTVRDIDARGFFSAIRIDRGSSFNRIIGNELHDNDMKSDDRTSDAGAIAVDVQGDDNQIAWNRISGSDACSYFFAGGDGSAVSIFGGRRNVVHHNVSWENHDFIELGDPRTADTVIAYNSDVSSDEHAAHVVVHGTGTRYGPVARTTVFHDSAYLSGVGTLAVQCTGACSPAILSFRDNIVWAEDRIGYADRAFDEAGNIYWRSNGRPRVLFPMDATSRMVDPGFADLAAGDLRLTAGSPAIDSASGLGLQLGFDHALDDVPVPQGEGADVGAFELPVAP